MSNNQNDNTTGRMRRRRTPVKDEELREAVYYLTPAGTSEVADVVGVSRQAAEYRLKRLEESGDLLSKLVGPTRVWIHPRVMDGGFAP